MLRFLIISSLLFFNLCYSQSLSSINNSTTYQDSAYVVDHDSLENLNMAHTFKSDFINILPFRGIKNIISLSPGIILHNDKIYSRGSRDDEIQYLIDGVPITDVMNGGYLIELPQEAFEEIEIQTGGVSAQYGNANSGYVFHKLKRGTSELKANLKYFSDNITFKSSDKAFDGQKRLGTYWFGHNEILGEISGPIIKDKITFYTLAHYKYERDQNPQPFPGASTGWIYSYFRDDSVKITLPAGAQPANALEEYGVVGNLDYRTDDFQICLNGIYQLNDRFIPEGNNVLNFMNYSRTTKESSKYILAIININHKIFSNTEYALIFAYSNYFEKYYDPLLKDDYFRYYDSEANENVGVYNFRDRYLDPGRNYINTFSFNLPGYINTGYYKHDQTSLLLDLSFKTILSFSNTLIYGATLNKHTIKHFNMSKSRLNDYNKYLIRDGIIIPEKYLQQFDAPDNYGYIVYGEPYDGKNILGAREPINANLFIEDIYERDNFSLSAGIRFDYFSADNYSFNYHDKFYRSYNAWSDIDTCFSKIKGEYFISPRITSTYLINNNVSFYAHYGKYVQQTKYSNTYQGMYNYIWDITGDMFNTKGIGLDLKPISTHLAEIGFKYVCSNLFSLNLIAYYKKTVNLPVLNNYEYSFVVLGNLENKGETKSKGIELSAIFNNSKGLSVKADLTFQDAQGPSIYFNSWIGLQYNELNHSADPVMLAPLENSYGLIGNLLLKYNFPNRHDSSILRNLSLSTILNFNTGHPYNRFNTNYFTDLDRISSHNQVGDFNSFSSPSVFQMDLRIIKSIMITDRLKMNFDLMIINLFDIKNEINVYPTSGDTDYDNIMNSDLLSSYVEIYGEDILTMYKTINLDYYNEYKRATGFNLFGPPRQIFFGVTLEY